MSQVLPEPNGATPPDPAAGSGDGGTQTPEGFVPKVDFERTEAQRREFQRRLDIAEQKLRAAETAAVAPAGGPPEADAGFDPVAFRRQLLNDFSVANQLRDAAVSLQAEFPNADPALFRSDAGFASVDALRLAAEANHLRVTALVDAQVAAREAALREENAKKHGGSGSPGTPATPGDPTPAEFAAMSMFDQDLLEKQNPGVTDRILRSAT